MQTKIISKILFLFILIIFLLTLLAILISAKKNSSNVSQQGLTPTVATPTPTIFFNPSKWAGDNEVLSIESETGLLEKDMENVDLKLLPLMPPNLDTEVKF